MVSEILKIETESIAEFDRIAKSLMNDFAIENHDSVFRLTEIEFYWNSPTHNDESTYKRTHVDPENGDWFFHYSGVDIALKSEHLNGYGGILIRSVLCFTKGKKNKLYKGPMVCAMKLFSGTSAFSNSIKTRIIKHKFEQRDFSKTPRVGLGKNAEESGTKLLEYRYNLRLNDH